MRIPNIPLSELKGHDGAVNAIRFSADGAYCMSCGEDRSVKLWNPSTGLLINSYEGHGYSALDVCIAKDNARFASAGGDRAALVWDVTQGRVIRKLQGHTQRINALAMNEESSVLLTASYDRTVCAWDLRSSSREPIQTLSDFRDSVSSVVVAGSKVVAGCVDGALRVYDVRAGAMTSDDLGDPITHVSAAADHRCVLSACLGDALLLTDLASGRLLQSFSGHRHEQFKVEGCLLADECLAVAGSEDGGVFAWDILSGQLQGKVEAHARCVTSVSAHPSAPRVLSAGADGAIKMWDFQHSEQV